MQVKRGAARARILVTSKDRSFCGELGQDLAPQQFLLKTGTTGDKTVWSIGGDDVGALYGAYRFAERLGIQFGLDEAAISTAYRGAPRIFVSAKCSQMNAGEAQEIRAFVLSKTKCTGVNLHCRSLGDGPFTKVAATHKARQAYRFALPAQAQGAAEYYLEAVLDDG